MKKLLLGCGILLLVGLGTLGFVVYQLWPEITHMSERAEIFSQRVAAIERANPFDPEAQTELDTTRFVSYLEMRVDAQRSLSDMVEDMHDLEQQTENDDVGLIERLRFFLKRIPMVYDTVLPLLEKHQMSLAELGWHTRVLWATLENIDAGGAGEDTQLSVLRGVFPKLREAYDESRGDSGQPLEKLLAGIDAKVVGSARRMLALDVQRVQDGLLEPSVEAVFLLLSVNGNEDDVTIRFSGKTDDQEAPRAWASEDDQPAPPDDG